jgi:acyl-coenzyme A synthetase/AMP-(fatty) acid ligase
VHRYYTVRALTRFDAGPIGDYDLSTLRVLGTVGEPINPEAWKWVSPCLVEVYMWSLWASWVLCDLLYVEARVFC